MRTANRSRSAYNAEMAKKAPKAPKAGTEVSQVALDLKRLREQAGYTLREFASALDIPLGTYRGKEERHKKPYLPMDFVQKIKPVLGRRGVAEAEIMALAMPSGTAEIIVGDASNSGGPIVLGRPKSVRVLFDVEQDLALLLLTESSGRVYEVPMDRVRAADLQNKLSKFPEK